MHGGCVINREPANGFNLVVYNSFTVHYLEPEGVLPELKTTV